MADATYTPKVYRKQGGDELVVASGGKINIESGGIIEANGVDLIDELAALSGLDATELGYLDGVTAGTVLAGKAVVTTTSKHIDALVITDGGLALGAGAGTAVTSTAAELNILDGVTSTAAELNVLDGVTSTAAELNILDGVTSTAAELNILDGVTATAAEINSLDDSAVFADGLSRVRVASATYDFAVDGGAISAIDLGVTLPDNAIILDGMVDVITTLTTAGADAGTIALHANAADDIVTAIAVSDGTNPWDEGLRAIKQLGTSTTVTKLTAARAITATIAGQAVTAGKFVVFLRYVLSA